MLKLITTVIILILFSSCSAYLPEFERAESLEQGEQRLAMGAFVGGFPNVDELRMESSSYGVAAFHSIGISDNYDWSTLASIGGQNWYNEPAGLNLYSISTGPKFSFGAFEAITIPITYMVFPNEDPLGDMGPDFFSPAFGVTPTYYGPVILPWWLIPGYFSANVDASTFLRSELMVGQEGPIFGLTAGYRFDWPGAMYAKSFNINFGISGIYFGYAMDLLP
jgi:hypothetical protein